MSHLHTKAWVALLLLFLAVAALMFIPAWTLDYWQAWMFLAVYFGASVAITLYLMKKDPQLLARRMSGGPAAEKLPAQKIIMSLTSLGFIGLLVIPALDRRFAWFQMPPWVALAGDVLVGLGFLGAFYVFRGKQFHLRDHRIGAGPKSHFDRALRAGAAPDVCCRPRDASRYTDCARLLVGRARFRGDPAGAAMEIV
jgi:hypothetical protein